MAGSRLPFCRSPGIRKLRSAFRTYLKGKTCRAFNDGVDVYLTEDDRVIPDAMIVCNKNMIALDGIHGAPDLIVEVLLPSTAKNDRGYKKDLYEQSGVKEYWIVNPIEQSVYVYVLEKEKFKARPYTFRDRIKPGIYDDMWIDFTELKL